MIEPRSLSHKFMPPDIGYLKVNSFPGNIGLGFARDLDHAVDDLKRRGATRLLIDLRGNIGGAPQVVTRFPIGQLTDPENVGFGCCPSICIHIVRTSWYSTCVYTRRNPVSGTTKSAKRRGENINLRVSRGQKSLIDRAAQALGRNRSDFMLETACREAESVLLDRRYFALPEEEFRRFTALLDKPPASNPRLARLLKTKAPWDK